MSYRRFIRTGRWEIVFFIAYGPSDWRAVSDALTWADAPRAIESRVKGNVLSGDDDNGFTYSNGVLRRCVVGIGRVSSGVEMLDSTVHELIHLSQDIALADGVSLAGEDIAYLGGSLSHGIADLVCELACPHCSGGK